VDTVHECDRQTDGRTDGRTDRITITDTVQTASHGKNVITLSHLAVNPKLSFSILALVTLR